MNRQVFRNEELCRIDQGDSPTINCRLADMQLSSMELFDGSTRSNIHRSPISSSSFDHIIISRHSKSIDEGRDSFEIPELRKNLSFVLCRDYPSREVVDSRDPEDDQNCDSREDDDERTETIASLTSSTSRNPRNVFTSSSSRVQNTSLESSQNESGYWGSTSSLKRANPIYESDAEYEEIGEPCYRHKRRCSIERVTTAVYWRNELKSADE